MRPIRAVLIDIDGVLTVSWKPLPGAVAALQRLRAAAFPLALVTNTTSRTRASIASALAEAAFPVSVGDILTAPVLAAAYLQDHYPGARCLLLSSGDIGQDLAGHYGVQLWTPEAGGRVDYGSEHDEKTMTMLGLSSKREITRTSIRVRAAMAVQTREQGRYLGGRPPYGYRLADAGPHPNKAHAAWGRRAHCLEPDTRTAPALRWIFAQRLAGHSVARIARALNEAEVPCPSAADPARNTHRTGAGWTLGTVTTILENPRYTGRQVWNRQRTDTELADPANVTLGHKPVQRWNLPDGWVISSRSAHPALVSEDDFIAAQGINAARGPVPRDEPVLRRYLLAGLLACGLCGRRMESAWSNGRAAYRCRHGRTSAMTPDPARPKNTYIREDKLLPHLPALHLLLTSPAVRARRRTRAGADVIKCTVSPAEVIRYLHEHEITLTWNPATAALQARATQTAKTVTVTAH
ncbi:MAG: recombinase family protein [Streptosporangiaceae bacterium]